MLIVAGRSPPAVHALRRRSPAFWYNGSVNRLPLLATLLLAACTFDRAGKPVTWHGSPDISVADQRAVDLVSGADVSHDLADASPDSASPDAPDPCTPNPCQNGGTCAHGDGGVVCQCAVGFEGPSCDTCALGYSGATCAACPQTKLTIQSCTHPTIACGEWIDGDNKTSTSDQCQRAGCFATDVDFDLGSRQYVNRIRFLSDWWAKRPGTWELWASDDNVSFSIVMDARSNKAPWKCIQGDPCTAEVPTECCPGGATQDTTAVGSNYPKWDDFTFSGVVARFWRFRILTTDDSDNLIMRELELYGHDCLGELACATPSCGAGVCTGQEAPLCACAGCVAPASCTSAFTGAAPACTTPAP